MTKKIQADWLRHPGVQRIITALGATSVRFVGGAVRDTLLGLPVSDIDAATVHTPEKVVQLLETAQVKVIPTGLKHGTVTAIADSMPIEVTTLRRDVKTDGRHAEVAFTDDWLEDAKRRDFTFNALYLAADGTVFDPFDGETDLKEGTVRFIGDAGKRIEEDALRILRYFRFFAGYDRGQPDAGALAACQERWHLLKKLSVERIRDELLKLLSYADPSQAVALMQKAGVLETVFEGGFNVEGLQDLLIAEKEVGAGVKPYLRFYHLVKPGWDVARLVKYFKLSGATGKFLSKLEAFEQLPLPQTDTAIRRALYYHGGEAVTARMILAGAGLYERTKHLADHWTIPVIPVTGQDMIKAGCAPGPSMGHALKKIETLWIDSDFTLKKPELLQVIKPE